MKPTPLYIAALAALAACSAPKDARRITVEPAACQLAADTNGHAAQQINFHIPAKAYAQRARLIVKPMLFVGDTAVAEYDPIVADAPIYAKKMHRRARLDGYQDPYADVAVTQKRSQDLDHAYNLVADMGRNGTEAERSGRVRAVVYADGCGCTKGIDTLDVATITQPAPERPRFNIDNNKSDLRDRRRIHQGAGTAHLQFVINLYDIRPELANNRAELEHMAAELEPILKDPMSTITSINICGVASVDGPLAFNTTLSLNRAKSARAWLIKRLHIGDELAQRITISSRPEGWQPVIEAMDADKHPYADRVRTIVREHAGESDDVAEKIIRRLPCWPDIRRKYLQKDRKADYEYTYTTEETPESYEVDVPETGKEDAR